MSMTDTTVDREYETGAVDAETVENLESAESAAAPWFDGATLAPEAARYLAGKGYRSLGELVDAYREMERYQGKSIALPRANAREEDWARVWDRLGRPQQPDGYRFASYDNVGEDDRALIDWFRGTAHQLGLTQRQAEGLLDAYAGRNREQAAAAIEQARETARAGLQSLAQEWGAEAEANFERARRAVLVLELDERELASLAAAMGSDAGLLRLLSRLGPRLGEDTAVGRGRDPLALSPGQAQARIERIYQDPGHAYHDGDHPEHAAAVQEMLRLNEVLHGEG